ncbi:MAG: GntP family permease, partial [Planctomycetales bacterium]
MEFQERDAARIASPLGEQGVNAFVILMIGMAVVIGGVLVLRLHAFLALTLAALTVAFLTSSDQIREYAQGETNVARIKKGMTFDSPDEQAAWERQFAEKEAKRVIGMSPMGRVADGFGSMCGKIGILIAMAAVIGKCLIDSGAADRIVRTALNCFGEARASLSFLGSGFLLGIPVFFDTVFYLMLPLGKAMRVRTGKNYLLYIMAIGAGATMAHSLVPPTPGPLAVAEFMGVDIGTMILGGCAVSIITGSVGYGYALIANRIWEVPLRESPDLTFEDLKELSERKESELPPTWLAVLPIILPVILIGGNTIVKSVFKGIADPQPWQQTAAAVCGTLGDKNIALIISAAIALLTLAWIRRASREKLAESVQTALAGGGVIILITAAGGGFGTVLKQTGIAPQIGALAVEWSIPILPLAFFVTALIRTAQGSAT